MSVLFDNDMKSGNVWRIVRLSLSENISTDYVWKCVALFGSNSLEVPVMFDMNSENVFTLIW